MPLSPMRFKEYVWPHNPHSYQISYRREVAAHKVPFGAYTLQGLGRSHRVLKGEGEFAGEGAYDEFKKLANVFYGNTPGLLVHPVWQKAQAYFVGLELTQEPAEDYVRYRFEFWECYDEYETEAKLVGGMSSASTQAGNPTPESPAPVMPESWHTAVWGDTLWGIATANGLTLDALLALNPQIKNPNILMVGDRVRVG